MDLQSAMKMSAVESSHQPFWCRASTPSLYRASSRSPSPDYYFQIHFMSGPIRTSSTNHRANPLDPNDKPPRPPNAWILYRSDKMKELRAPPGAPKKPQSEISKTIAEMWRNESDEMRRYYEHLSEIKKAEHQAEFPGYRFQPIKREEKERIRAEKQALKETERALKKARGRGARRPAGEGPLPLFTTEARLLPGQVSNVASSASDPMMAGPSSQPPAAGPSSEPSSHLTPSTDATSTTRSHTPSPYPPPPTNAAVPQIVAPKPGVVQRPPSPSDWPSSFPAEAGPSNADNNSLGLEFDPNAPFADPSDPNSYLTIPLPSNMQQHQTPLSWNPSDLAPLSGIPEDLLAFLNNHDSMVQATAAPTDEAGVFNLFGNFDDLFDPSRPIEVSMASGGGEIPDLSQFGFSNPMYGWDNLQGFGGLTNGASASFDTIAGADSPPRMSAQSSIDFSQFTFDQSLSLESSQTTNDYDAVDRSYVATPTQEEHQKPAAPPTPPPAPYVPPAGAAHANTRRVAANWAGRVPASIAQAETPRSLSAATPF